MSEETRRLRQVRLDAIDAEIEGLQARISGLEDLISALEEKKWSIPELEEDRQWRLERIEPWEKYLHEMAEIAAARFLLCAEKIEDRFIKSADFFTGQNWPTDMKIGASFRIKFPSGDIEEK